MPDSIRELLQGIADEHSTPSGDLAAGAFARARTAARRRFAAAGIAAVVVLAGIAAAAIAAPGGREGPPPGVDPSTDATAEETAPESACSGERAAGVEFPALGESGTMRPLEAIPDDLFIWTADSEEGPSVYNSLYGGLETVATPDEPYRYHFAPDGNRAIAVDREGSCAALVVDLEDRELAPAFQIETTACEVAWSPDSDKVLFHEPLSLEDSKGYLLDVAAGELTEVDPRLGCGGIWSPDGTYAVRPDGENLSYSATGAYVEVPMDGGPERPLDLSQWAGDVDIAPLSSLGDGRACLDPLTDGYEFSRDRCELYVDLATGEELELPDDTRQAIFLADGSMLLLVVGSESMDLVLMAADGEVLDERAVSLSEPGDGMRIVSYYLD